MRRPLLRKEYLDEIALIHQTALTLDGGSHREEKNPPTLQTERRPGGNNKSRRRNTNFNKRKQFIGEEGNEEQEEIKHQDKDEPNAEQEEEGNTSLLQGVATGIEVALAVYDDLREMARWVWELSYNPSVLFTHNHFELTSLLFRLLNPNLLLNKYMLKMYIWFNIYFKLSHTDWCTVLLFTSLDNSCLVSAGQYWLCTGHCLIGSCHSRKHPITTSVTKLSSLRETRMRLAGWTPGSWSSAWRTKRRQD